MAMKKEGSSAESIKGRAIGLGSFVGYEEGAVVSRTIIDKKMGTVTVFAFDAGEGLSEHTAPYDALICILDGAAEITISGRAMKARSGEFIIMPAGEPHSVRAIERFKMLLIMIRA